MGLESITENEVSQKEKHKYALTHMYAQAVKNLPAMWEIWVWSLDWEDALEEGMATYSSILENPYGQRSLVGYSPWGCKELDMSEPIKQSTWNLERQYR